MEPEYDCLDIMDESDENLTCVKCWGPLDTGIMEHEALCSNCLFVTFTEIGELYVS